MTPPNLDNTPPGVEDPDTLCANWERGCNGVTDGAVDGHLTLCDECKSHETNPPQKT
jgi:hypothetical protein